MHSVSYLRPALSVYFVMKANKKLPLFRFGSLYAKVQSVVKRVREELGELIADIAAAGFGA